MADLLFLDPNMHPYIVLSIKGNPVGRFSNLALATQSVLAKSKGGMVVLPDGRTLDRAECSKIVESWKTVKAFAKREPTGMVA